MTAQEISWLALWGATALYAIAMVASSFHLAQVADARVQARAKRAVAAGSASTAAGEQSAPATSASAVSSGPTKSKARGIAQATLLVGGLLNLVGVVGRAIEASHVPWSNMYGYTITGVLVAVATVLVLQRKRDVVFLVPLVAGLGAMSLGLALRFLYEAATGLQPALQSFWIIIHVSIAILGTGIFIVGAVTSILQLMRDYRDEELPEPVTGGSVFKRAGRRVRIATLSAYKKWTWLEAVPTPLKLEALSFRLHAVGFVLWTFTLVTGAVWAEHAWGRYWGWDPKEVWTFVIWVIYAAYLHARTTQGWAGRRSAYIALVGFVALILNFTVVNLVFQGLHSYA